MDRDRQDKAQGDAAQRGHEQPTAAAAPGGISGLIGGAYRMAYLDPFTGHRPPQPTPGNGPAGRDPGW